MRPPTTRLCRPIATGEATAFEYKPDKPTTNTVAAEIFVYLPLC